MKKICSNRYDCHSAVWTKAIIILAITVFIAATPQQLQSTISRTIIWQGYPQYGILPCFILDQDTEIRLSKSYFGEQLNYLDLPFKVDAIRFQRWAGWEHYFVLDKSRCKVILTGTYDKALKYVKTFGEGYGNGVNQYKFPEGIAVQRHSGDSHWHRFFILDTGNRRIQRLQFNRYTYQVQHPNNGPPDYIYSVENNHGYGPLNKAHDIAYCRLSGGLHAFLVVADTYNHRILFLEPDGEVIRSIGGPEAGSGAEEFQYPYGVTAVSKADTTAYIYVADRGNSRVVQLHLEYNNGIWYINWLKTMDFPSDDLGRSIFPAVGLEDVEVDDSYWNGVWVLDSRNAEIVQIGHHLETVIQRFDDLQFKGAPLYDLSLSLGNLSVLCPYTQTTGLELFVITPSIVGLSASPNPFMPPLEHTTVTIKVDCSGYLDAYVREKDSGLTVLPDLAEDRFVYPHLDYLVWDGKNSLGIDVAAKTYEIVCSIREGIGTSPTDTKIIEVTVIQDPFVRYYNIDHLDISYPQWSPDGNCIVYSARDGTDPFVIAKFNLSNETETILTGDPSSLPLLGDIWPSWSSTGDKIAFAKKMSFDISWGRHKIGLFIMDPDGGNLEVVSDTTDAWLYETRPKWLPNGGEISYLTLCHIEKVELEAGIRTTIYDYSGEDIQYHSWSPNQNALALSREILDIGWGNRIYMYDIKDDFMTQLTFLDGGDGNENENAPEWSPNNNRILFIDETQFFDYATWQIYTVSASSGNDPESGVKVPVGGLNSEEVVLRPGLSWSPDGTKIAFIINDNDTMRLVCADYIRNEEAFPGACIHEPLSDAILSAVALITGTVQDNVRVLGDSVLSELCDYYIEYGKGRNPATWSCEGIELAKDCTAGDCQIVNDTLALWNTGIAESGLYTIRLIATDGEDSNTVYRHVNVVHHSYTVIPDGSGDYTSIQDAIDAAEMGDTVYLHNGEYSENITLKQTLSIIGAGDSVRIIGGDETAVRIRNHPYPCKLTGISIHNDDYYLFGRGILIDNASPEIRDCTIAHNGSEYCTLGGGVTIGGNSYPRFVNCVISNNRATNGGGIKVDEREGKTSAPTFVNCCITGNEAITGGGIYLYYHNDTPLDTTHTQPTFSSCILRNNVCSSEGSAIYMVNCHAARFHYCDISSNEIKYNNGTPVYGYQAGGIFHNCTIAGNEVEDYGTTLSLAWYQLEHGGIVLEKCIVALNNADALYNSNNFSVNRSCFYGNSAEDSLWINRGEGNFLEDPAFCDRINGEYSLYCFSPCALHVSGVGQIGAYGAECVPPCDSLKSQDECINVCPAGDWDSLLVIVDLKDSVLTRDIEADELVLLAPFWHSNEGTRFFKWGLIHADSAATNKNSWRTTFTHKYISGCGDNELTVLLDGKYLVEKEFVSIKSPDSNMDGTVNLSDLVIFGLTYNKCPGDSSYNACFDFVGDECVRIHDLVYFSNHYLHEAPDTAPPALANRDIALSDMSVKFIINEEKIERNALSATVLLENANDISVLYLLLQVDNEKLTFAEWIPNPEFPLESAAFPNDNFGKSALFVVALGGHSVASTSYLEMGTIIYHTTARYDSQSESPAFSILIGDIQTTDGKIWRLKDVETEREEDAVPLRDHLAGNYPNPFNPSTVIEYSLARDCHATLYIYNVNGQLIRTLFNNYQKKGNYKVIWDGKTNGGKDLASGVYFYRLKTDYFEKSKKLILMR